MCRKLKNSFNLGRALAEEAGLLCEIGKCKPFNEQVDPSPTVEFAQVMDHLFDIKSLDEYPNIGPDGEVLKKYTLKEAFSGDLDVLEEPPEFTTILRGMLYTPVNKGSCYQQQVSRFALGCRVNDGNQSINFADS